MCDSCRQHTYTAKCLKPDRYQGIKGTEVGHQYTGHGDPGAISNAVRETPSCPWSIPQRHGDAHWGGVSGTSTGGCVLGGVTVSTGTQFVRHFRAPTAEPRPATQRH